ncbi:MAG: universal stress protein, partial [Polyangiaceae bacterium]
MKLEKIVVATDFSESSEGALDYALGLAEKAKAEVVLVNVFGITVLQLPDGAWIPQPEVVANLS